MTTRRSALYVLAMFVALAVFWAAVGARLDDAHPVRTMFVVGGAVLAVGVLLVGSATAMKVRRLQARRRESNEVAAST